MWISCKVYKEMPIESDGGKKNISSIIDTIIVETELDMNGEPRIVIP